MSRREMQAAKTDQSTLLKRPWWAVFLKAFRAAVAFFTHAILAVVLIACILLVERALNLSEIGNHLLVGAVPVGYLFDLIDAAVIIVCGIFGIIDVARELRGHVGEDNQ